MPVNKKTPVARTTEAGCQLPISKGINDMTSVAKTDLTFQNFTFSPVTDNGQIWFTSAELAKALKYKKTDSVSQIYARNADEFTDSMTTTLKMRVVRKTGDVQMINRLFSLRGAHLIAMFASTPVAKEFRKWVLDILDKEAGALVINKPITQRERDAHNINALFKHYDVFYSAWKAEIYPTLRQLESPLASRLFDRFQDGYAFLTILRRDINERLQEGGTTKNMQIKTEKPTVHTCWLIPNKTKKEMFQ